MRADYYNNIGIGVVALSAVLEHLEKISISKAFLVMPFITHLELTDYLARKNTTIKSIEELIAQRTPNFSNFNKRYYDSLTLTTNAIQYLIDMKYIELISGDLKKLKSLTYDRSMGTRADKIYKASNNIASLLQSSVDILYLNLRVEL